MIADRKIIAKNIVEYRKQKGLNQKALAELLELPHQNALSVIECGKRDASINVLLRITNVLNISPDCLFEGVLIDNSQCDEFIFENEGQRKFYDEWKSTNINDKEQMLKIMDSYKALHTSN